MIGGDFLPNDVILFGLTLTEPTDFIYDIIIGLVSLYFAFKIKSLSNNNKLNSTSTTIPLTELKQT